MIHRRHLVAGLGAVSLGAPALAAQAPYRPLFDGKSLDGWDRVGVANWTIADGVLSADKGAGDGTAGFLLSKVSYRDFDLRAEFWVSEDANSGIFIRCTNRTDITSSNAYEVNIFDTRPDPTYGTGGIVNVGKVAPPMPKAGGKWNVMRIVATGDAFTVILNDRTTVDGVRDDKLREGAIALQYGAGVVRFRRVDIRTT
jgi:hypothetical protein